MYIVTFYSFKGGVGRTMALANIANAMAARGKTVLLVDFDLEAPGIETFNELRAAEAHPGLVEFVAEYQKTNQAPDIKDYVHNVGTVGPNKGKLYVMPAGLRNSSYGARLNSINWQALYREQDGFVLFEDMKKQWEKNYKPDYVLIDSRTGHTDVGGICTRQLPDHVVMLFFPNAQNLRGISKVAEDIRRENQTRAGEGINITFVCSNVPDMDDEDRILAQQLRAFDDAKCAPQLVIHHYPSMRLLDQEIFTRTRPNSRLARQYDSLRKLIIQSNSEDRDGTIDFLESKVRSSTEIPPTRLRKIVKQYSEDPDILFHASKAMDINGMFEEKQQLLKEAARISKENRNGKVARATILRELALYRKAARIKQDPEQLWQLIFEPTADVSDLRLAVELLNLSSASDGKKIVGLPVYSRLNMSDKNTLLDVFFRDNRFGIVKCILESAARDFKKHPEIAKQFEDNFALPAIAAGKTRFAIDYLLVKGVGQPKHREIIDAFNFAMARWKHLGSPQIPDFETVLRLNAERPVLEEANYFQCIALANWVVGNLKKAKEALKVSFETLEQDEDHDANFSAWSYLWMGPDDFKRDLDDMRKQMNTKKIQPNVIRIKDMLK